MKEARNPKLAEDIAGDTATDNASQRAGSESDQRRDANSSENFADNVANSADVNTTDSTSPERDSIGIGQGRRSDGTDAAGDPM